MARIVVTNSVSLDGVMQAPARPDEDPRGGFQHGGWALPYNDEVMARTMGARASRGGALLLGRRTYEDFAAVWPTMPADNPFTAIMNDRPKYVVSSTLSTPLAWAHTKVLEGDAIEAVRALKAESPDDLAVLGSGELTRALLRAGLVDEVVLLIHPLVLGAGVRLFDGAAFEAMRLVDSVTTTTGVVIATYQPEPPAS